MSYNKDLNHTNAALDANNEGLGHINGSYDSPNLCL